MALAEIPQSPPTYEPDLRAVTLSVVEQPSQAKAALYDTYVLPDYERIAGEPTVQFGEPEQQGDYGVSYMDRWQMNDEAGTEYKVQRCLASKPRSSLWVVMDTAWGTQPEGYNTDVARKLMSKGFNVLIKGPEISSSLPMSQSAFNTHKILDELQRLGELDASLIAVEGYSRGAMIAFGTNAYAKKFNRQVIYTNFTDPCVALPITLSIETVKKALALPKDLGWLAVASAQAVLHPTHGKNLLKTVDLSLNGAVQFYRTGGPLMNGEAGKMASRTPEDMKATVAFFRQCGVNDNKIYRQILADRPGVRFVTAGGGHGGGIDQRIIGNIAVPFDRLGEQLQEQRTPDEINYRYVLYGRTATA